MKLPKILPILPVIILIALGAVVGCDGSGGMSNDDGSLNGLIIFNVPTVKVTGCVLE